MGIFFSKVNKYINIKLYFTLSHEIKKGIFLNKSQCNDYKQKKITILFGNLFYFKLWRKRDSNSR